MQLYLVKQNYGVSMQYTSIKKIRSLAFYLVFILASGYSADVVAAPVTDKAPVAQKTPTPSPQKTSATGSTASRTPTKKVISSIKTIKMRPAQSADKTVPITPVTSKADRAKLGKFSRAALGAPAPAKRKEKNTLPLATSTKAGIARAQLLDIPLAAADDEPLETETSDEAALAPHRRTFPGDRHTMSHFENKSPTEMGVRYKITNDTAARLSLNSQDEKSPLYTPLKEGSNATGVYLDMNIARNVQMQVGGEYRNLDNGSQEPVEQNSKGAAVGMKWSF